MLTWASFRPCPDGEGKAHDARSYIWVAFRIVSKFCESVWKRELGYFGTRPAVYRMESNGFEKALQKSVGTNCFGISRLPAQLQSLFRLLPNFLTFQPEIQKMTDKHAIHYSSKNHRWETPKNLFDALNAEFHFSLDAASSDENAKTAKHFTKQNDALMQDWTGSVFCNPPYGCELPKFIRKGWHEVENGNAETVVFLIPARTDTKVWHAVIFPYADEIRFLAGRVRFELDGKPGPACANFPSALVIFRNVLTSKRIHNFPTVRTF